MAIMQGTAGWEQEKIDARHVWIGGRMFRRWHIGWEVTGWGLSRVGLAGRKDLLHADPRP
jgi:hypothetical protein